MERQTRATRERTGGHLLREALGEAASSLLIDAHVPARDLLSLAHLLFAILHAVACSILSSFPAVKPSYI